MCKKGRSPNMRHVPRLLRINLDFIFERIQHDDALKLRYVNTKFQAADIFTKGSFTQQTWNFLLELIQVRRATTVTTEQQQQASIEQSSIPSKPSKSKRRSNRRKLCHAYTCGSSCKHVAQAVESPGSVTTSPCSTDTVDKPPPLILPTARSSKLSIMKCQARTNTTDGSKTQMVSVTP